MNIRFWTLFAAIRCWATEPANLEVAVKDERRSNCQVYVAVYRDPRTWLSENPYRFEKGEMKAGAGTVQIMNLPPGKFAILAYCDKNGNGKLDENLLGVPKEPYGFSNGKPGQYELRFAEAAFEVSPNATKSKQEITLLSP
jgi:uncharacterized protein (DUF2141 family)